MLTISSLVEAKEDVKKSRDEGETRGRTGCSTRLDQTRKKRGRHGGIRDGAQGYPSRTSELEVQKWPQVWNELRAVDAPTQVDVMEEIEAHTEELGRWFDWAPADGFDCRAGPHVRRSDEGPAKAKQQSSRTRRVEINGSTTVHSNVVGSLDLGLERRLLNTGKVPKCLGSRYNVENGRISTRTADEHERRWTDLCSSTPLRPLGPVAVTTVVGPFGTPFEHGAIEMRLWQGKWS